MKIAIEAAAAITRLREEVAKLRHYYDEGSVSMKAHADMVSEFQNNMIALQKDRDLKVTALRQQLAECAEIIAKKDQQLIELDHCREAASRTEDAERKLAEALAANGVMREALIKEHEYQTRSDGEVTTWIEDALAFIESCRPEPAAPTVK
jgi:hypothetical protein